MAADDCIALSDILEGVDCESLNNMGGLVPSIIYGYHSDVEVWPEYPKKADAPIELETAGALVGDVVMKGGTRAYKMEFVDDVAEFKITEQGETGGESYLFDLNIVQAKIRKKILGFQNATKGRKMFFIVEDNNGTKYLMGDARRGAVKTAGDGATTGASPTARNQASLHYTYTTPMACVYEGDTDTLLSLTPGGSGPEEEIP